MSESFNAKRTVAFFAGCIGTRVLLAEMARRMPREYVQKIGIPLAMSVIVGWLYIIFVAPRDTGPETFGGRIWWQKLRPLHILLYAIFIGMAWRKPEYAWVPLLLDVVLAFVATAVYRLL